MKAADRIRVAAERGQAVRAAAAGEPDVSPAELARRFQCDTKTIKQYLDPEGTAAMRAERRSPQPYGHCVRNNR